jgi:hypothetical protein
LQKSARGVGLREAILVAARAGDGGLALRQQTVEGRKGVASSTSWERLVAAKGLWRVTRWWKASWTGKATAFHGVAVEAVLVEQIGRAKHARPLLGDGVVRVAVFACLRAGQ